MTKTCTVCKQTLDLIHFYKDENGKNGTREKCKKCFTIDTGARQAKWRDLGVMAMYASFLARAFPERTKERRRLHRLKHLQKHRARNLKWKLENKDKALVIENKRRAIKNNSYVELSNSEKLKLKSIYSRAEELRQWFNVVVDHILPLSQGGKHHPGNLQIIYRTENDHKHCDVNHRPSIIFS